MSRRTPGAALLVAAVLTAPVACSSAKTKPVDVAACKDIALVSQQLNSIPDNLAGIKALFREIKTTVDQLVRDAPADLKTLAGKLEGGINTAKPYVDRATSIDTLHDLEQKDPLQSALSDLATYGSQVGDWKSANCKG